MVQKSAKVTKLTTDATGLTELAAAALACPDNAPDVIPAGWFSVDQAVASMALGKVRTRDKLNNLVENDKAERKKFRIISTSRMMRTINHYRLKKS